MATTDSGTPSGDPPGGDINRIVIPEKGMLPIWFSAAAVAVMLLMVGLLVGVVFTRGLQYFWVNDLIKVHYIDESQKGENPEVVKGQYGSYTGNVATLLGEASSTAQRQREDSEGNVVGTYQETRYKKGNRDLYGSDFQWIKDDLVKSTKPADDAWVIERLEHGNFYGFYAGREIASRMDNAREASQPLKKLQEQSAELSHKLSGLRQADLSKLNYKRKKLRTEEKDTAVVDKKIAKLKDRIATMTEQSDALTRQVTELEHTLREDTITFTDVNGQSNTFPVVEIVRAYQPNRMGVFSKLGMYASKVWEVVSTNPREANTEGGIFPAIYGTVMMVFIMSIFVMPFGVISAIYLRVYAKEGLLVRIVRIAVNNLAGVPSIVYGIFGLGFFIIFLGGGIDSLFYPWKEQATFKQGGILWASLTLALLTVPVVIVATEESLAAIPRGMREGSLALGATQWQTVRNVLLPMASPGILTGFILSMARAAGEVAPLMLTGVVKHTEAQPFLGSHAPHINSPFMHLGFHIYDTGFQSPNVEATMPMVYVTTLLLLTIVIVMNIFAIIIRNRLRKRLTAGAF